MQLSSVFGRWDDCTEVSDRLVWSEMTCTHAESEHDQFGWARQSPLALCRQSSSRQWKMRRAPML